MTETTQQTYGQKKILMLQLRHKRCRDRGGLPQGFFFENARLFIKNVWHFKDIFREFEAFLKISILFEDISREIGDFFK
jgi:hypothetical protein